MRILFVCTGNICRSPMGERLTRAFLDDALGVAAASVQPVSAGTHAVVGSEMERSSALALAGLGGNPEGFRARQLTGELADAADLTLTMTRRHRRSVLKLAPRTMFRTFTLREAADLLQDVDLAALPPATRLEDRMTALVAALGAQRARRGRTDRDSDDVTDPMGRAPAVHQAVGEAIFEALTPLLQALCGNGLPAAVGDETLVATSKPRLPVPPPVRRDPGWGRRALAGRAADQPPRVPVPARAD